MLFAVLREGGAGVEGVDFDLVYGGEVAGGGGEEFVDLVRFVNEKRIFLI